MTQYQPVNRPGGTYQNRYQRDANTVMGRIYDAGPYIVAIVSFLVALVSLVSLLLIDVIIGRYSSGYMSNSTVGWFFSLGTTGIGLAAVGTFMYGLRDGWSWKFLIPLMLLSLIPLGIDVYFDAMSVDIIKYGHFIDISTLPVADQLPYRLFRIMVGAMSALGEPLSAGSIIIFPVLRELFKGVFTQ